MVEIVDTILFNDELKMLEMRLNELSDVVDYFVIAESIHTFNGDDEKPLYYNENKKMFESFSDRIIHVVIDDMLPIKGAWDREHHSRNAIQRGVEKLKLSDNDYVMLHDTDEIPNSDLLKQIKKFQSFNIFDDPENLKFTNIKNKSFRDSVYNGDVMSFEYDLYYYSLECRFRRKDIANKKILTHKKWSSMDSVQDIRSLPAYQAYYTNAGWHISYVGEPEWIAKKLESFSHQEYNSEYWKDLNRIRECCDECKDLFERPGFEYDKIPLSENNNKPINYKLIM